MSELTNAKPLHGEIALVTAATRGIGRACALALGQAGAHVAVGCRDQSSGNEVAAEIRSFGARATAVVMDMTEFASFPAVVKAVEQELGLISILVNNAGNSRPAPALDVMPDDYDAMFDLNVKGAFFAAQAVARGMSVRKRGAIVNIASQAGVIALPNESIYCMTKASMIHMTRCLAVEWGAHQIRVNAVAPTFIRTDGTKRWLEDEAFKKSLLERIPLGRVGEPGDVAAAVAFLASSSAAMITGSTLMIDGGWTAV